MYKYEKNCRRNGLQNELILSTVTTVCPELNALVAMRQQALGQPARTEETLPIVTSQPISIIISLQRVLSRGQHDLIQPDANIMGGTHMEYTLLRRLIRPIGQLSPIVVVACLNELP